MERRLEVHPPQASGPVLPTNLLFFLNPGDMLNGSHPVSGPPGNSIWGLS